MDTPFRSILVPVDGSESSLKALATAARLAHDASCHLTVLEVIEEFGPLPGYYEAPPPGVDRVKWLSEQRFERAHELLDHMDVRWDRHVIEGSPPERICEAADEGAYDLIVMGCRGLNGLQRFLMGSVSNQVVLHAPCSVLVVR